MSKPYRIQVFGKSGCAKCKALNGRLDRALAKPAWQDFEKSYCDVETEEGLITFCRAECINPNRIPAFMVLKREVVESEEHYRPLPNPDPDAPNSVCDGSILYLYQGLQTDYSGDGQGLITPKMLEAVLERARAS